MSTIFMDTFFFLLFWNMCSEMIVLTTIKYIYICQSYIYLLFLKNFFYETFFLWTLQQDQDPNFRLNFGWAINKYRSYAHPWETDILGDQHDNLMFYAACIWETFNSIVKAVTVAGAVLMFAEARGVFFYFILLFYFFSFFFPFFFLFFSLAFLVSFFTASCCWTTIKQHNFVLQPTTNHFDKT